MQRLLYGVILTVGSAWTGLAHGQPSAPTMSSMSPPPDAAQVVAPKTSGAPSADAIIDEAQSFLGVPYRWGGVGAQGFDCSGYVRAVFAHHGYGLPRVSREQARVGLRVSREQLQKGDLLFFTSRPGEQRITHVAISLGGSRFIHAALGRGEVAYDALTERYFDRRFFSARRPLALPPGQYATQLGTAVAHVAVDTPEQAALVVSQRESLKDPFVVQRATQSPQQVPRDALHEHDETGLPPQLDLAAGSEAVLAGTLDRFGEEDPPRRDTGFGMRLGLGALDAAGVATATPELRYFGPGNGLHAAVALPLVLRFDRRNVPGHPDTPTWESVRQDGRIVRALSFGRPGARLYVALRRDVSMSLNDGTLMRHFMPNVVSSTFGDLLIQSNALSAQFSLAFPQAQLSAILDDVFSPSVLGIALRLRPWAKNADTFLARLEIQGGWAADLRAPTTLVAGMVVPADSYLNKTLRTHAFHTMALGVGLRLIQREQQTLRAYATAGGVFKPAGGSSSAMGSMGLSYGLLWPYAGGTAHSLVVRSELRISGAHARPALFDFDYAATRRHAFLADQTSPLPLQDVLALQHHQPATISGLIEVQGSLSTWVNLGLSLADGGPRGHTTGQPRPSDGAVTAYVGLPSLPIGPGGRAFSMRAMWHQASLKAPWPWRRQQLPHTFMALWGHLDLTDWFDVSLAFRKPLGQQPQGARPWALEGTAGVHKAF